MADGEGINQTAKAQRTQSLRKGEVGWGFVYARNVVLSQASFVEIIHPPQKNTFAQALRPLRLCGKSFSFPYAKSIKFTKAPVSSSNCENSCITFKENGSIVKLRM